MIKIRVEISASLAFKMELGQQRWVNIIDLPEGATVRTLVEKLREDFGEKVNYIYDADNNCLNAIIAINDRAGRSLKKLDTELQDGEKVTFLAVFSGG